MEDAVLVRDAVRVPDALAVDEREPLEEGVPVWLAVADGLRVSLMETVAVRLGVRLPVALCVEDVVPVRDAVRVPDALAVADREPLEEGVPVWLAVADGLRVSLMEPVPVRLGVRLPVAVRVGDVDVVDECVGVCVADRLADTLAVSLRVCEEDGVPVREPDALLVGVRVWELLLVSLRVWDAEGVPVRLADVLLVGVRVADDDDVAVAVAEAVAEAVADAVCDVVDEHVPEPLAVEELLPVTEPVELGEGVVVGVDDGVTHGHTRCSLIVETAVQSMSGPALKMQLLLIDANKKTDGERGLLLWYKYSHQSPTAAATPAITDALVGATPTPAHASPRLAHTKLQLSTGLPRCQYWPTGGVAEGDAPGVRVALRVGDPVSTEDGEGDTLVDLAGLAVVLDVAVIVAVCEGLLPGGRLGEDDVVNSWQEHMGRQPLYACRAQDGVLP